MISDYLEAVYGELTGLLDLLTRWALPLALGMGLLAIAAAISLALNRDAAWVRNLDGRRLFRTALGYLGVLLLTVAGWAALRTVHDLAQQDLAWRESAEATANPTPDAPPASQFGPSVGVLREKTYTRTLTLPPYFLQRLGAEGLGVLSPYLSDPSAENVLRLADTFRRSGQDVVFTRELTRVDEEPLPFASSQVQVKFQRLAGRVFDTDFEGRYTFRNDGTEPANTRFQFPLPSEGTLRDLSVRVGDQTVPEPAEGAAYEWTGILKPGEQREAVVRYRVQGGRVWRYDLGSRRRRVQQFQLTATGAGAARFLRGSLQPSSTAGGSLRWDLSNIVTAQQVALVFPAEVAGKEAYLQALTAVPAAFMLFLIGMVLVGLRFGPPPTPARMAAALALFILGLATSLVLANYLGAAAGVLLGPLIGAALTTRVLGRWGLVAALPCALLPAAFLSPQHSGLLVLLLAGLTIAAAFTLSSRQPLRAAAV